jgi:tRNA-2-methylthio-N6-dimethylallyladenosine synthase
MSGVNQYYIVTFGCQQNIADSERIVSFLETKGMKRGKDMESADYIVINTCMVRESAENRVYGLINNLQKTKDPVSPAGRQRPKTKIVLTGCMVGMAVRDKSGKFLDILKKRMPEVDEFLPVEEVGFDYPPKRKSDTHAFVPVSNGCNNFCTYCVVPFSRGREISRPYREIIKECRDLAKKGYKKITLLGMNVNSYGADLMVGKENVQVMRDIDKTYFGKSKVKNQPFDRTQGKKSELRFKIKNLERKPVYVKHLGRYRIPTLFPYLLNDICKTDGIEEVDFMSSNPWDFSDELIGVIAGNPKVSRSLHIAVQSGSNSVLKRMNRWYTAKQYLGLILKLKAKISNLKISTDIIVGFCAESKEEFQDTVNLCKKIGFYKAYISIYSDRPMTAAHKVYADDVPYKEKKRRWRILEELINKPNLKK